MADTLTPAPKGADPRGKNLPGEIWKAIDGFDGYEVSNKGRVRSKWRILKQVHHNRYRGVNLKPTDGAPTEQKTVYVHHLVCAAFHGEKPEGSVVIFGEGGRDDLSAKNLRWGTRRELGLAARKS